MGVMGSEISDEFKAASECRRKEWPVCRVLIGGAGMTW